MRTSGQRLVTLLALALCGCGARTIVARQGDVVVDAVVDAVVVDVVIDRPVVVVDVPAVIDRPVVDIPVIVDRPAPVDLGPPCVENLACNDDVAACVIGRTRCVAGQSLCLPAGDQLPGTACPGGTCDGRGGCRMPDQRSCPMPSETGCGVVFLTGGTFPLGDGGGYRASPVQPSITVGGFALDAYEVTVARFQRYWSAGHPAPAGNSVTYPDGRFAWSGSVNEPRDPAGAEACNWGGAGRDYHPLNCVDWATAQAFCVWDGGRLPTEAEWEYAARQVRATGLVPNRRFPWGDATPTATCDRAQWTHCRGDDGASTRRVGSFANTAGFFDLAGNVWEWTADLFAPYSDARCWGAVPRTNPRCTVNATGYPSIRGGSWYSPESVLLQGSARDDAYRPGTRSALVGFRCAHTRTM